jgi:hypothetical protein
VVKNQSIIVYLLTFLILSVFLRMIGIIEVGNTELLGYILIFYGVSQTYLSIGKNRKGYLFTGTFLFLTGIFLFIISNFEFDNTRELIFPSLLFITGICCLMLFIDDRKKSYLIISVTLIFTGLMVTVFVGSLSFSVFIQALVNIILKYWLVVLIVLGIILILHKEEKR